VQAQNEGIAIDASKVSEANLIDLPLADNKGVKRSLTELNGKVVLLDFHIFAAEGSSARILAPREPYNKYHDRGLEIYQVSLDENEHFWKTQTAALPWVCVYENGNSSEAYLAPVSSSPVFYLIDRDNNIVRNPSQIKDIAAEIERLL
jgi:peroxiredoxin